MSLISEGAELPSFANSSVYVDGVIRTLTQKLTTIIFEVPK